MKNMSVCSFGCLEEQTGGRKIRGYIAGYFLFKRFVLFNGKIVVVKHIESVCCLFIDYSFEPFVNSFPF